MVTEIRAIHAEHRSAHVAPRVHAELRSRGRIINRKRVTRLMRVHHLVGRHLRSSKRTAIADRSAPPVPDLVMRDFTATAVDIMWCGDITWSLTPDLGHAESSTLLGKRESKDGQEELHRRVPSSGGGLVRVHAGRDAQGDRR